jgi:hypothetical protein
MGRKKYTMKQTQYGRNMLIGEYLWLAYCQSLPPGVEPDPQMMRERKKVSSHIQVLKNFFVNHRCCKFGPTTPAPLACCSPCVAFLPCRSRM